MKTKIEIANDIRKVTVGAKSYDDMINIIVEYIWENFKWKDVVLRFKKSRKTL